MVLDRFDKQTKDTFDALLGISVLSSEIRRIGADAEITVEDYAAFRRTLTLKNAGFNLPNVHDILDFSKAGLTSEEGVYKLTGTALDYETDESSSFTITFTDAASAITVTRNEHSITVDPWSILESFVIEFIRKYKISEELLNEKEKALLSLVTELASFTFWASLMGELCPADYPQLSALAEKYDKPKLSVLLNKLCRKECTEKQKSKLAEQITSLFFLAEYEPLWRDIFERFTDSQSEYPRRCELSQASSELDSLRAQITEILYENGYSGSYPSFVKHGSIMPVRLGNSYSTTYFVGLEKNVTFHIHCFEESFNGHLMIRFVTGTRLLHKSSAEGDIYSCAFNAKGKRFFGRVTFEKDYLNDDGSTASDDLEGIVRIAVKKAELKRLTKSEYETAVGFKRPTLQLFIFVFLFMGTFFGLFMTLGFALLAVLACLIVGQPGAVEEMLTSFPWWQIFLFTSVSFGGIMGALTVLSHTK